MSHTASSPAASPSVHFVLWCNAGFSALSGLVLIVDGGPLAPWLLTRPAMLGLSASTWLIGLGIALLPFALAVGFVARRKLLKPVPAIIAADIGWVAGSALLVAFGSHLLTATGIGAVVAVAAIVAGFAFFQYRGLRAARLG